MDSVPDGEVSSPHIRIIPIAQIHVVNARERNRKKFQQIVGNIADVGLKKPITVSPRADGTYDLVCGQGRLEAFKQLGQTEVPALVREVTREELLLMSIVENMARTRPSTMETVRQLAELRERGYTDEVIGQKTGLSSSYIHDMLFLYDHGEERVLYAAESGRIPLYAAMLIAHQGDGNLQAALTEAVATGKLATKDITRLKKKGDETIEMKLVQNSSILMTINAIDGSLIDRLYGY
jgi:ParB family chromosome partitioning protein